jgi:hypothetical protein
MSASMKGRLFGFACLLVSGGLFAYNWYDLLNNNTFSLKLGAATPILMLASVAIIIYPPLLAAHLSQDKRLRRTMLAVVIAGGLLSGVNYFMMDRYRQREPARPLNQIPPMPGESAPRPNLAPANNRNAPRPPAKP